MFCTSLSLRYLCQKKSTMNYNGDLGVLLYLPSIISSLCFSLTLFVTRKRTLPQFYLAINFLLFGAGMLCCFVYERYIAVDVNEMARSVDLTVTAIGGVLILFYFTALMTPSKLTKKYLATYISATVLYSLILFSVDNVHLTSFAYAFRNITSLAVVIKIVGYCLIVVLAIHVAFVVIRRYIRHRRYIKDTFSYEENINLKWVLWVIAAFLLFTLVVLIRIANTVDVTKIAFNISVLPLLILIYIYGFRQGEIPVKTESKDDPHEQFAPDTSIATTIEQVSGIASELIAYFEKEKPYLNPELSLTNVADALKVNRTYLSRVINSQFNMNFYTFVNNYRIDHALKIISSHDETKSDTVSSESGFKTRSVFYNLFSKRTGLTPQEYKNKNLNFK